MKHSSVLVLCLVWASSCSLFDKKEGSSRSAVAPEETPSVAPIVIVVPHQELTKVLPAQLEGFQVALPPGVVIDNGAETLSRARADYWQEVNGEVASLNLEIVDGTHVPSVQVALALATQTGGGQRALGVTVGGYPADQRWNLETNSVTTVAVIAKRFVVTLKGTNAHVSTVKRILDAIDVKRLEALAGVEPEAESDDPAAAATAVAPAETATRQ